VKSGNTSGNTKESFEQILGLLLKPASAESFEQMLGVLVKPAIVELFHVVM
jgi:hypothetical protein